MGAVTLNIGPPAALYCIQLLGLIPTSGAKGAQTQRYLLSRYRLQVTGHALLAGKMRLGWCSVCSQMRAVREFCLPHLLFFSSRTAPLVSVPALFLFFIQCGYLWASGLSEHCFECNFFRGIWVLFSFSYTQVNFLSTSSQTTNPCLPVQAAAQLTGSQKFNS